MSITEIFEKVEAVIFDLDGVLVDTAVYHFQAWKRLAKELGFDFTETENERLKGVSRIDSLRLILNWAGRAVSTEEETRLATLKNSWYLELVSTMKVGDVLPGTEDLLLNLKKAGKKIALGSASKNAQLILEKVGIVHYFDAIIDGNGVRQSKPHPEVFLRGAEALRIPPDKCVVFEDAQAGIDAAKAAGMKVIAVDSYNVLHDYDARINNLIEVTL